MIGDIVIIEPVHRTKANLIIPEIIKRYKRKMIVCIAGVSGTGKTEISSVIQNKLYYDQGLRSKIIHTDDYYRRDPLSRKKRRERTRIINEKEINWGKLRKIVRDFKSGGNELHVQRIHKYLDSLEYSISKNRKIDILIVEGIYALYLKGKDFGVYLEGNIEDTYCFRKKRGKENPDNGFRKFIVQEESRSILRSKQYADLVIQWEM